MFTSCLSLSLFLSKSVLLSDNLYFSMVAVIKGDQFLRVCPSGSLPADILLRIHTFVIGVANKIFIHSFSP